jgi:hypothetical protein
MVGLKPYTVAMNEDSLASHRQVSFSSDFASLPEAEAPTYAAVDDEVVHVFRNELATAPASSDKLSRSFDL